jgi:hypothetical protein
MYLISGIMNVLLACIIFWLGARDMNSIVYEIPAVLSLIIGRVTIWKSGKQMDS